MSHTEPMKVLIIEDDEDVRDSIAQTLRTGNYEVDAISEGTEGLYRATEWSYDAIILDVMLPGIDGWEILRSLREKSIGTPVLMLSALSEIDHRVKGLEGGADDYLVKPYHRRELLARVRALTRRTPTMEGEIIQIGRVTVNLTECRVELDDEPVELTASQFQILGYMARRVGRVVTRSSLVDLIYGDYDEKDSNVIDVQVYHIRRKLGKEFIVSRRGFGYEIPKK